MSNYDLQIQHFNKKWDREISRLQSKFLCNEPNVSGKTLQEVIEGNSFVHHYMIDPLTTKNELTIHISISEYHYNNLVLRATAQRDIHKAVSQFLHNNADAHKLYRNTLQIERISVFCFPMSPSVRRIIMIQKAFHKISNGIISLADAYNNVSSHFIIK